MLYSEGYTNTFRSIVEPVGARVFGFPLISARRVPSGSTVENVYARGFRRYSLTEHGEQKLAEIRKRWRQQVQQWSGAHQHESVIAALEVLDVLSAQIKE